MTAFLEKAYFNISVYNVMFSEFSHAYFMTEHKHLAEVLVLVTSVRQLLSLLFFLSSNLITVTSVICWRELSIGEWAGSSVKHNYDSITGITPGDTQWVLAGSTQCLMSTEHCDRHKPWPSQTLPRHVVITHSVHLERTTLQSTAMCPPWLL